MTAAPGDPQALLRRSLESGRLHSAYLLSGPPEGPREAALWFARGVVCSGPPPRREACPACRRSRQREILALDGSGKKGPLLRHVGDHPDLLWVERGVDDTRVRIGQIRALQSALRLRAAEGERRVAVIADAEWLNQEAQNALLRLLEEPPPGTLIVLVARSSAGLLATVRSRCQRLVFRPSPEAPEDDPEQLALLERLEGLRSASLPALLDWAEEYRGARSEVQEAATRLLETGAGWLRRQVAAKLREAGADPGPELQAHSVLAACRKSLVQRNANPQMVAERAARAARDGPRMSRAFFATTPIYYVNAEPHIGHTYTTVAVDTLARYHRLCGEQTYFLTGTDEHGEKIAEAAEQRGLTPKDVADQYSAAFHGAWQQLGFSFDRFIRTTDPDHVATYVPCCGGSGTGARSTSAERPLPSAQALPDRARRTGSARPRARAKRRGRTTFQMSRYFGWLTNR
jgi:DNA polymerase III delta prime subunit